MSHLIVSAALLYISHSLRTGLHVRSQGKPIARITALKVHSGHVTRRNSEIIEYKQARSGWSLLIQQFTATSTCRCFSFRVNDFVSSTSSIASAHHCRPNLLYYNYYCLVIVPALLSYPHFLQTKCNSHPPVLKR